MTKVFVEQPGYSRSVNNCMSNIVSCFNQTTQHCVFGCVGVGVGVSVMLADMAAGLVCHGSRVCLPISEIALPGMRGRVQIQM